jgi:hypothetical protein
MFVLLIGAVIKHVGHHGWASSRPLSLRTLVQLIGLPHPHTVCTTTHPSMLECEERRSALCGGLYAGAQ